jgi:uncharacterized protein DUF6920
MANRASALAEWQFVDLYQPPDSAEKLLSSLHAFCFPDGEGAARQICAVKVAEKGEMRASPEARWIPFSAEQTIDATESHFLWTAHLHTAGIVPLTVTDAYEHGHGRLLAKVGPLITKESEGPVTSKGEIQRYLASLVYCPAMLLNHPSLEWTTAGPLTLRVHDRKGPTDASVEFELTESGKPVACTANRPRLAGKRMVMTPWMGVFNDFREHEGMRVPQRIEVSWLVSPAWLANYHEGWFAYYRSEITSLAIIR